MQETRYSQLPYRNIGFTLIELLVVITILAVVGAVTFVSLSARRGTNDLTSTSAQIVATLRTAQSRSMTQMQGKVWGVRFGNPTNTSPFYALFSSSYGPTTTVTYYSLPTTISYVASTVPPGGSVDVIFSQVLGSSSSTSIGIFILNPGKKILSTSSIISVASSGAIAY